MKLRKLSTEIDCNSSKEFTPASEIRSLGDIQGYTFVLQSHNTERVISRWTEKKKKNSTWALKEKSGFRFTVKNKYSQQTAEASEIVEKNMHDNLTKMVTEAAL